LSKNLYGYNVTDFLILQEGLTTKDRCLHVDEFLSTAVSGLFAAGDVASFPSHHTGSMCIVFLALNIKMSKESSIGHMLKTKDSSPPKT
jgi:pyruvate/2-oxoglutarate dehydrogenase complex dihydrolipoamide dehydrogenase (E3) component